MAVAMTRIDYEKVNGAIRGCLVRCCESDDPLAALAELHETLRSNGGWSEAELHEVDVGVRLLLCEFLRGATCPGDEPPSVRHQVCWSQIGYDERRMDSR